MNYLTKLAEVLKVRENALYMLEGMEESLVRALYLHINKAIHDYEVESYETGFAEGSEAMRAELIDGYDEGYDEGYNDAQAEFAGDYDSGFDDGYNEAVRERC